MNRRIGEANLWFSNRIQAGRLLAHALSDYAGRRDVTILGLPRGGAVVAAEVARTLGAPLFLPIVRRVHVPGCRGLTLGAVAPGGLRSVNAEIVSGLAIPKRVVEEAIRRAESELPRLQRALAARGPCGGSSRRTAIVVDDGMMTGASVRTAIAWLRQLEHPPRRIVAATPVARADACRQLYEDADDIVCLSTPQQFHDVAHWYGDFRQTTPAQLRGALARAVKPRPVARRRDRPTPVLYRAGVRVVGGRVTLEADVVVPDGARAVVLLAHGNGSSRHSPRNMQVARAMERAGLATVRIDLRTPQEKPLDEAAAARPANTRVVAERIGFTVQWMAKSQYTRGLPIGIFGASNGAAGAMVAAARYPRSVRAVVSRAGRPDLAASELPRVGCPVLLIVAGNDRYVTGRNLDAFDRLRCTKQMRCVRRAGHLFEEPGALARVSRLSCQWFLQHLGAQCA